MIHIHVDLIEVIMIGLLIFIGVAWLTAILVKKIQDNSKKKYMKIIKEYEKKHGFSEKNEERKSDRR